MSTSSFFDLDAVFHEDYLYFYEEMLTTERTEREADAIWRLCALGAGAKVLELGCGHGRICNALARRGANVTGIDQSKLFLAKAIADAAARGLAVDYREGDIRAISLGAEFDAVLLWFTTFGYFSEAENTAVLEGALRALKPGGRLIIEQVNRLRLLGQPLPYTSRTARGDDLLLDTSTYDGLADRVETERISVRGGRVHRTTYSIRLYGFAELTTLLQSIGFGTTSAYGEDGTPFTLRGKRLITVAEKPGS